MLFLTNFLSILLAGGGVLVLLGLGRVAKKDLRGNARRNAFLVVAAGLLLVSVPLAFSSARVASETLTEFQIAELARTWVSQSDYEVRLVDAQGDEVSVRITGEGDPPLTSDLVAAIQEKFQRPIVLDLESDPIEIERIVIQPRGE